MSPYIVEYQRNDVILPSSANDFSQGLRAIPIQDEWDGGVNVDLDTPISQSVDGDLRLGDPLRNHFRIGIHGDQRKPPEAHLAQSLRDVGGVVSCNVHEVPLCFYRTSN